MLKKFFKLFVELTGHPLSSRILQWITTSRWSSIFNRLFVKTYAINIDEADADIRSYKSLQSLFTRKLKPGSRVVDSNPYTMVSPVDGVLSAFGKITEASTFPVKGQVYPLTEVFGEKNNGMDYQGGYYFVFYLSPGHYHRIHSPIGGTIVDQWNVGRVSFPVNQLGLKYGGKVFSTNYRLISEMTTEFGKVAVVKVGALNVNSIHLTHPSEHVEKGEELGYFSFGSTVIVFVKSSSFHISEQVSEGMDIQYGQPVGSFR